jgi:polyphosphate kinase
MTTTYETPFTKILEAADELLLEDQEDLIRILQSRLRDRRRAELVRDVQDAQQEFALGQCQTVTPEQLMEELLS